MNVPESTRLYITLGNVVPLYITLSTDLSTYDLTSATVWFTVKRFITDDDAAAIFQKKTTATISIADATSGMIKIPLTNDDTKNLVNAWYATYIWDLQVKDKNNNIITTTYGSLGVYPAVTQTKV